MSETYVECLVARKPSMPLSFLKILLIMLTVVFVLVGVVYFPGLIVAVVTGVGAYFATMNANIEYEYLYLDREISVDKVMAKSRRKKTLDYSSGVAAQPERRYMMIYEGNVKVIIEPNAEMIKAIQSIAPRKVFTD